MRIFNKRTASLVLVLALCLSLLTGIDFNASAATVEYVTGNPLSGYTNVIMNWGTRGTVATFLSPNAEAFYEDNNITYAELSQLSGSSSTSSVPSSALYSALHELVESNQTKETSYADTRQLFAYTDCQDNGNGENFKISAFYSGKLVGPAWDSGKTWNREHTWPNSKGDANGNGENDIMMLRPASSSVNSGRGNKAYGESSGFYNPNSVSGGTYNLHGDVARIVLYVYTRWGTANMWGSSGVIESKEILLKWMEEDPVDTWEMGRNDSTESITGTRNIYVDYPELAFLLFNEDVPVMATPSGIAAGDEVITPPTTPTVPTDPRTILEAAYALGANEDLPYRATLTGTITEVSEEYSTQYKNVTVVMEVEGCEDLPIKCYRLAGTGADQIGVGDIITVTGTITNYQHTSGNLEVEFKQGCTLDSWVNAGTGETDPTESTEPTQPADPDGSVLSIADAISMGEAMAHDTYSTVKYKVTGKVLQVYDEEHGNMYLSDDAGNALNIYGTYNADGTVGYANMETKPVAGDTVTIYGYVGQYSNVAQIKDGWIVDHVPGEPPATEPVGDPDAEISFADKANRISLSDEQQVWQQNGITVTNDRSSSTTKVADYADPARFYKNSKLTIAAEGMVKIVVDCNTLAYATALVDSIPATAGVTVSQNVDIVTIEFAEATDSFVVEALSAGQVRVDSIGIYTTAQSETVSGDFTGDTLTNNDDVVYLLWHTLFPTEYPVNIAADFTNDGLVNNDDVVSLLWHTLFPDKYPL